MEIKSFLPINKYERENVRLYGSNIYHYTSIQAFINIVTSNQLWFGYTKNMNDTSEVLCFLQNLVDEINVSFPKDTPRKLEVLDLIKHKKEVAHVFIMCFSKLEDDAAQWERYADNAKGVCLKFNTVAISRWCTEAGLWLQQVYYSWNAKSHAYFQYISQYILDGTLPVINDIHSIIDNMGLIGLFHKHHSFSSENEVRLIKWFSSNSSKQTFVHTNGIVKKMMVFDFNNIDISLEDLIDEIIIGPRSQQSVEELKLYVDSLGFHKLSKKIRKSDCPLR